MTDPTRPTGATLAQIEAGIDRCLADEPHRNVYGVAMQTRGVVAACAIYLVPPDQCIVPRSFVAAAKAVVKGRDGSIQKLVNAIDALPDGLS